MKNSRGLTMGSLFDGSGGFCLAAALNGIEPVWSSEIEPYCLKVTALRFPNTKQLGDITKINGAEIQPVDIITFGSPCQDLSVAGNQVGIKDGPRSSLFFEAIRIIREMRDATANDFPRYAVWENVPGAFSSNKGEDFRAVLESFVKICGGGIQYLCPIKVNGNIPALSWTMVTVLPGECSTRNSGESPNVVKESTLWQVLETNAPEKYYLSKRACQGIVRRAQKRGKPLPDMLLEALMEVIDADEQKPRADLF